MSSKDYLFVEQSLKRGKLISKVTNKFTIKCLGGESMAKENPEIVFVKQTAIPKLSRGKTGRNWKELFDKIPEGEAMIVPEAFGTGATVRQAVKGINEELGEKTFKATQRTEKDENGKDVTSVYVLRVEKEK